MSTFPGLTAVIGATRVKYDICTNLTGTEVYVREVVGSDVFNVATFPARDDAGKYRQEALDEANAWIDAVIARAVVEFATTKDAVARMLDVFSMWPDKEERIPAIRAALGEENTDG